ncbi:MAG: MFS transporter [Spirochaetaceae bacterium]|jgi:DHA3 family macrolide efflux protein-like MFS transporter|nr:MFS transporter [Spirochaetaceae bacterium]
MTANWKRNTVLFLGGQALSLFGSSLVQYAITWYITLKTQSGVMMTISIICGMLPSFFISPFGGVWADRFNRRYLITIADGLIALATLALALLFMAGYEYVWLLFVSLVVRALGSGVQIPAVNAFIPQIVPEKHLTRVSAINGTIQSVTMIVSPMMSAALLTFADIEAIFFIDVVTAALAIAVIFFFIKTGPHIKAAQKQETRYASDMIEGVRYIRKNRYIKRFFLFCALFNFFIVPAAVMIPLQVTRNFGPDLWRLSATEITFFVGMSLGGIAIGIRGGFKSRIKTMATAFLIFGICSVMFGAVSIFWIYLIFMGIAGIILPFFNTPATVLLQERVEESYMGRVFGVLNMIWSISIPLGMVVFGPLADILPINWLFIGSGAVMFALSAFLYCDRTLRGTESAAPGIGQPRVGAEVQKDDPYQTSGTGRNRKEGSRHFTE